MKPTKILSYLFFALTALFFVACKPSKPSDKLSAKSEKDLVVHELKNESTFDKQMAEIDTFILAFGSVASSLDYSKEDGTFEHVDAHMNKENEFIRLDETFKEKNNGPSGINYFYVLDGKTFCSRQVYLERPDADEYIEKISYYSPSGDCLKTKQRSAQYEELLKKAEFKAVPRQIISVDKALAIINQKGEYTPTFQGFVESPQGQYMVVGQPGNGGFTSALKITTKDDFIKDIEKDQIRFINGTIYLNYEKIREMNGFTYQKYIKGSWTKSGLKS